MAEAGVDGALIVQPITHMFDHSYVTKSVSWPHLLTFHSHYYGQGFLISIIFVFLVWRALHSVISTSSFSIL